MRAEQAKKILKRFNYRLLKQTNICVGTAVVHKEGKWKLQIYLRDQLDSHKHLLNLRFGETARLIKKEGKELPESELTPELIVVKEFTPFENTGKYRPCPGGVSIGHPDITAGTFGVVVYRPRVNDCKVTGTLNPNTVGQYIETVSCDGQKIYNGKSAYRRKDEEWLIWCENGGYYISPDFGVFGDCYWEKEGPSIEGEYTPAGEATGVAIVELVPTNGYSRFILSNNHVLANSNLAEIGDPIYQPGPFDGGEEEDTIGLLEDFVPIIFDNPDGPYNHIDAAICRPFYESDILDSILDLSGLTDIVKEAETDYHEKVIKVGRTTEYSWGFIYGFTGIIGVNYGIGIAYFDDQIVTDYIGAPGDSGSFLMSSCGKRAVGLLFAGSPYYQIIIYGRATKVEEELEVLYAPVKRLPTMIGRIVGKTIETVRKICLHCCCPTPTEPPPPPPPPPECPEIPDAPCYSLPPPEIGCDKCTVGDCTSMQSEPPWGEPPHIPCPPLYAVCGGGPALYQGTMGLL